MLQCSMSLAGQAKVLAARAKSRGEARPMTKRTTAAIWVRGIVEMLAAERLDVPALLAAAGIDPAGLDAPGARLSTDKISLLWQLAAERSGNAAIGLAQHDVAKPANFDVVGYTMMSCADLLGAFERLERYLRILSDAMTMSLSEEGGRFRMTFELIGGERPVPRQRIEFIMVTLIGFLAWISGRDVRPVAIELPYPAPQAIAPYREVFRCPITFDADSNSLLFSRADLALPLPTSNPVLAEMHERYAGDYLRRFDHDRISHRAREAIIRRLPDGEPRRDRIANELRMSERTLQRRLGEEKTSFVDLVDGTRRELAGQYLGRLHLSLGQAAYLLGYADQSSFFRACKRWFEVSPGQYRNQLLGHPLESPGNA
jgi:AraC-like DNA-binding protein